MSGLLGTVYPLYQLAYVGYNIKMMCYSSDTPRWSKRGREPYEVLLSVMTLTLNNVDVQDEGEYICSGTILDLPFNASSMLYVGSK